MFFRGSRYEHVEEAELEVAGRVVRYKRMRFVPESGLQGAPGSITAGRTYAVKQGDRADLAAYATLGDPEAFWRLCDLNRVQRPADLTATPGARIAIPGPGGGG